MRALFSKLSPLVVISPVVLAATLALAGYSFRFADEIGRNSEQSLLEANRLLGDQSLDRIDNFIIDSDRVLFEVR